MISTIIVKSTQFNTRYCKCAITIVVPNKHLEKGCRQSTLGQQKELPVLMPKKNMEEELLVDPHNTSIKYINI